jgi:hypothetical protein
MSVVGNPVVKKYPTPLFELTPPPRCAFNDGEDAKCSAIVPEAVYKTADHFMFGSFSLICPRDNFKPPASNSNWKIRNEAAPAAASAAAPKPKSAGG